MSKHTRSHKKGSYRRRHRRGGDASTYVEKLYGDGMQQFQSVFGPQNTSQSNAFPVPPPGYTGGKKSKGKSRRNKKGGFWGQLSQALVPFGILGLQQTFKRGKRGGKGTKRRY
jgi:hypothetical protein